MYSRVLPILRNSSIETLCEFSSVNRVLISNSRPTICSGGRVPIVGDNGYGCLIILSQMYDKNIVR